MHYITIVSTKYGLATLPCGISMRKLRCCSPRTRLHCSILPLHITIGYTCSAHTCYCTSLLVTPAMPALAIAHHHWLHLQCSHVPCQPLVSSSLVVTFHNHSLHNHRYCDSNFHPDTGTVAHNEQLALYCIKLSLHYLLALNLSNQANRRTVHIHCLSHSAYSLLVGSPARQLSGNCWINGKFISMSNCRNLTCPPEDHFTLQNKPLLEYKPPLIDWYLLVQQYASE